MATRPAQDFIWSSDPGNKVDPGSGKKDIGFNVAERPPRSWINYLFNLIAQWIAYFRDIVDSVTFRIPATDRRVVTGTWTIDSGDELDESTNGVTCRFSMHLPRVGWKLDQVDLVCNTATTNLLTFSVVERQQDGTTTTIAGPQDSADLGDQTASITAIDHTTLATAVYYIVLKTSGGGSGNREVQHFNVTMTPA